MSGGDLNNSTTSIRTSWFSWWFNTQPTTATSAGVADQTQSRIYLKELKETLNNQFRAERAECRLDMQNPLHYAAIRESVAEMTENLMCASIETIKAEVAEETLDSLSLRKVLAIREKRRMDDLEQRIELQTDYINHLTKI